MSFYNFQDINGYPIEEGDKIAKFGEENSVYIVEEITAKGMLLNNDEFFPWEMLNDKFKLLEKAVHDIYEDSCIYITLNKDMIYYTEWSLEDNDGNIMLVSFKDGVAWKRYYGIMHEGKSIIVLDEDIKDSPYNYYSVVKKALGYE